MKESKALPDFPQFSFFLIGAMDDWEQIHKIRTKELLEPKDTSGHAFRNDAEFPSHRFRTLPTYCSNAITGDVGTVDAHKERHLPHTKVDKSVLLPIGVNRASQFQWSNGQAHVPEDSSFFDVEKHTKHRSEQVQRWNREKYSDGHQATIRNKNESEGYKFEPWKRMLKNVIKLPFFEYLAVPKGQKQILNKRNKLSPVFEKPELPLNGVHESQITRERKPEKSTEQMHLFRIKAQLHGTDSRYTNGPFDQKVSNNFRTVMKNISSREHEQTQVFNRPKEQYSDRKRESKKLATVKKNISRDPSRVEIQTHFYSSRKHEHNPLNLSTDKYQNFMFHRDRAKLNDPERTDQAYAHRRRKNFTSLRDPEMLDRPKTVKHAADLFAEELIKNSFELKATTAHKNDVIGKRINNPVAFNGLKLFNFAHVRQFISSNWSKMYKQDLVNEPKVLNRTAEQNMIVHFDANSDLIGRTKPSQTNVIDESYVVNARDLYPKQEKDIHLLMPNTQNKFRDSNEFNDPQIEHKNDRVVFNN